MFFTVCPLESLFFVSLQWWWWWKQDVHQKESLIEDSKKSKVNHEPWAVFRSQNGCLRLLSRVGKNPFAIPLELFSILAQSHCVLTLLLFFAETTEVPLEEVARFLHAQIMYLSSSKKEAENGNTTTLWEEQTKRKEEKLQNESFWNTLFYMMFARNSCWKIWHTWQETCISQVFSIHFTAFQVFLPHASGTSLSTCIEEKDEEKYIDICSLRTFRSNNKKLS